MDKLKELFSRAGIKYIISVDDCYFHVVDVFNMGTKILNFNQKCKTFAQKNHIFVTFMIL